MFYPNGNVPVISNHLEVNPAGLGVKVHLVDKQHAIPGMINLKARFTHLHSDKNFSSSLICVDFLNLKGQKLLSRSLGFNSRIKCT